MNYIDEMMKRAGVSETDIPNGADDYTYGYWLANGCPPFTAEKQLEIIKLICISEYEFTLDIQNKKCFLFATPYRFIDQGEQRECADNDFAQALAQLTTELMNAGELDKEKVREVLEGLN